ncbi:MAG: hypothetical protein WA485_20305 [Candidatus Sulfotelmatobacter sp.]
MARNKRRRLNSWLNALLAVAIVATVVACNSTPASKDAQDKTVDAASANSGAHVETLCVADRIGNPPEPFRYSYKYSGSSDSIDNEADITPQAMDIISKDASGSHSYHGVRSDENSWDAAILDLSSLRFTGLSARIDSLNGTSALIPQGAESVNGYKTTKYAIDTTRANSSDKQQFEALFNKGSFEKGAIWVPSDGCAVKLVLDEAIVQNDGSVDKGHYELAVVKK